MPNYHFANARITRWKGYWPRRNDTGGNSRHTKDANFVMNDMKLVLFNFVRTLYLKP